MASLTPEEEFQTKCKIIEEIKLNRPNIYNKAHPKCYDRLKKEASFDKIGAIIGQPGKFYSMTKTYMGGLVFYSTKRKEPGPQKHGRETLTSQLAGVMTAEEKQKIIDTFYNPHTSPKCRSPQDNIGRDDSHHGTRHTLSSKLSGVMDPDEISRIIREHTEDMTRPPLKPTEGDTLPGTNKPTGKPLKGNLVFVTHGIRKIRKRVCNFDCRLCEEVYHTQKDLNNHIRQDHPDFKFKCCHCTRVFIMTNAAYKHDMRQHVQGAHEGGFPCPCGAKEKWPRDVQKHKKPVLHVKILLQKGT